MNDTPAREAPTAGFRNAAWTSESLPDDCKTIVKPLRTADNAATNGFLFARGNEKTVVCIMHPREFLATHYLIPHILAAGCAAWTQASRWVGNDLRLEHETVLLDVAAAMTWLREAGFEKIILLGNSGGAGLYCFYNQQSLLDPGKRLARTPGGRPTALPKASMPPADGIILVSPHPGQGKLLQNCIDPSITDESDPFTRDTALDFMNPANGFNEPPNPSGYSADFIARFRTAQHARVEKLDAIAKNLIAERMAARKRGADHGAQSEQARGMGQRLQEAPLIVAAVDLSESQHELAAMLQFTVGRILQISPEARLTCLNVFKTSRLGVDQMLDETGKSIHLQRLIELKDWATPLDLPEERMSFHVLEAPDAAAAIIHFARLNQVDHLVMGARAASPFRRYLGSVSAQVVAEAPCSVTIIRLPEKTAEPQED